MVSSQTRDRTYVSCTGRQLLYPWTTREVSHSAPLITERWTISVLQGSYSVNHWHGVLVTQLCLVLCNPMDCSSLRSSVHAILQARTLEWIVIPLSRGFSQPKDHTWGFLHCGQILYHLNHQGGILNHYSPPSKHLTGTRTDVCPSCQVVKRTDTAPYS